MSKIYVVTDNIRSAQNVGSIFRTSDAFSIEKIYLCGISPTPDNKKVLKTSLGAEDSIDWEYRSSIIDLISDLKKKSIFIASLELTDKSTDISEFDSGQARMTDKDICLVVGNEVNGVCDEILNLSDVHLHIPMQGKKESLNVSVAFGIGIFKLRGLLNKT